jgi:hypothetical protein
MSEAETVRYWFTVLYFGVPTTLMFAYYGWLLLGWIAEVVGTAAIKLASVVRGYIRR